jgi:hypothetical protein
MASCAFMAPILENPCKFSLKWNSHQDFHKNGYQLLPKKKNSLNKLKSFPPETALIKFKQNK